MNQRFRPNMYISQSINVFWMCLGIIALEIGYINRDLWHVALSIFRLVGQVGTKESGIMTIRNTIEYLGDCVDGS